MDWKDQLSKLFEGETKILDVRLICIRNEEKWFLRRMRAVLFRSEPSVPEQISFPSYLFVREKMSSLDFLEFIHNLTLQREFSREESFELSYEEKLKKLLLENGKYLVIVDPFVKSKKKVF